jgi:putative Ca2+/H+ antiporter (TMEM165/GDT1 family)
MEALLVSTLVVALGEIGDKTQLLALLLAARFRRPVPIIFGIFVATMANHALAGLVGAWVRATVSPEWLRWILGLSFIAVALWALKPDKLDEDEAGITGRWGVFAITTIAFFLAEMGDKTQVATVMLAAKYESLVQVVIGTTLGMLAANVPVVFLGSAAALKLPVALIRRIAAAIFAVLGIATLAGFAF